MFLKSATVAASTILAVLIPAPGALASDDYRAVDPESGRIASFAYGESKGNWYHTGGYFPTVWPYSVQQLGAGPNPTAGVPFYLHARSRVILDPNERVAATVQFAIDQNAGGLTLRYAPSATMPMQCSRTQYRLPEAPVEIACPAVSVENGQFIVSKAEPLDPNYSLDVLFPVVVDKAASGTAAMTARWVTGDVTLSVENVELTVPLTIAANPKPTVTTKPVPKKLRRYKKVKSLTPKVCTVKKRKVIVLKSGVCKLKGGKVVVKKRY